jgi:hypothetical protein
MQTTSFIAEQACIVAILDKFDALTNSISEGLRGKFHCDKNSMSITVICC